MPFVVNPEGRPWETGKGGNATVLRTRGPVPDYYTCSGALQKSCSRAAMSMNGLDRWHSKSLLQRLERLDRQAYLEPPFPRTLREHVDSCESSRGMGSSV